MTIPLHIVLEKPPAGYCLNDEYCIATGDGKAFTNFYFKQDVRFFDMTDVTYWPVDKSLKSQSEMVGTPTNDGVVPTLSLSNDPEINKDDIINNNPIASKKIKSITISGKVALERYTELFNYFITPFAMNANKIEIEVKFKIKSNDGSPLDESKQQYKSAKEASRQLGLDFLYGVPLLMYELTSPPYEGQKIFFFYRY